MLTDAEIADMRADVSDYLTGTCTVHGKAGRPTFNATTGTTTTAPGAEIYDGPCAIAPTGGERVVEVGGEPVTLRTYTLRLPFDATGFKVDQMVTITALNDDAMVDKRLRVLDPQGRTNVLGRVLIVEDDLG